MYGILQSQENCRSHNGRKKSMEKEITKKIRVYGIGDIIDANEQR